MLAMRIAQVLLPGVTEYEQKSQRIDLQALAGAGHEVLLVAPAEVPGSGAAVAHVYGPAVLDGRLFRGWRMPFVASGTVRKPRFALRPPPQPARRMTAIKEAAGVAVDYLPEAVEEHYFAAAAEPAMESVSESVMEPALRQPRRIGSYDPAGERAGVADWIELTMARIHRFRDDVAWEIFDRPPSPAELEALDAWIDPAREEDDLDGFVAEALVAGLPVVASRTAVNAQRLEKGRVGLLVPPGDPNELTHAILTALFKTEVSRGRLDAARQTVSKYRPRHRLRVLAQGYESLIR
jgi:hypothetical protein